MFERFEEGTRRVLVVAQQEARLSGSGRIGTEHIMLALVSEGVAGAALAASGLILPGLRAQVTLMAGVRTSAPGGDGAPPFSPRAKQVLELAFRDAVGRGGITVGPVDLLLGLLTEGEGVGVRALAASGIDLTELRDRILSQLDARSPEPGPVTGIQVVGNPGATLGGGVFRRRIGPDRSFEGCALCGRDAWEVAHYVSDGAVMICQVCIDDAASAMRDAPVEVRRVTLPPRLFGTEPEPGASDAIARAAAAVVAPEPEGGWDDVLEDAAELRPYLLQARHQAPIDGAQGIVRRLRFLSAGTAWVYLTVSLAPVGGGFPFEGPVRLIDGHWKVTRELLTTMLRVAGVEVPPKS